MSKKPFVKTAQRPSLAPLAERTLKKIKLKPRGKGFGKKR